MQSIDHHAVVELRCAGLVQVLCKRTAVSAARLAESRRCEQILVIWLALAWLISRADGWHGKLLGSAVGTFAAASCRRNLGDLQEFYHLHRPCTSHGQLSHFASFSVEASWNLACLWQSGPRRTLPLFHSEHLERSTLGPGSSPEPNELGSATLLHTASSQRTHACALQ